MRSVAVTLATALLNVACVAQTSAESAPKAALGSPSAGTSAPPVPIAPTAQPNASASGPTVSSDGEVDANTAPSEHCEPEMYPDHEPVKGPFAFESPEGLVGFKDAQGQVIIPAQLQMAYPFLEQGLAAGVLNNQGVFFDRTGRVIAQAFLYDNGPDYFSEGRARIVQGGKLGFIDKSGVMVIAPQFDFATPFCAGRAKVCDGCKRSTHDGDEHATYEGGRWWLIDERGQRVNKGKTPTTEE